MMTGFADAKTAVEAMKWGALDYLVKPLDLDKVASAVGKALENNHGAHWPLAEMDRIAGALRPRLTHWLEIRRR